MKRGLMLTLALGLCACAAPPVAPTATRVSPTLAPSATVAARQVALEATAIPTLLPTVLPALAPTQVMPTTTAPTLAPSATPVPTLASTATRIPPTLTALTPTVVATVVPPLPTAIVLSTAAPLPTVTPLPPKPTNTAVVVPTAVPPTATSAPAVSSSGAKRRMVALVFGQSNAGNYGDVRFASRAGVYNLRYGRITPAVDPLRGAQGEGGSVWTRLGDQLIVNGIYDEVVFVPVSFGGTEIGQWVPEMPLFKQIESAVKDVHERGWRFTHLLWHHGESDNALKIGYADYQLRFRNMLRGIRELGVDAPIFVSVASRCGQYGPNNDIQGAQSNLVNHDQRIWAGPNTDNLGNEFRHDTCHLNAAGQNATANMWLAILRSYGNR
ncbi:MAG: hypothetical protein KIH69_008605 [Anaerolineae bacterium]|nr:hypothetical protein [Anaerolineae bacterium]